MQNATIIHTSGPVDGSIQWAMDRGKLYQVEGIQQYGQLVTRAEAPHQAANLALAKQTTYSTWVPPGTILKVFNVYRGTIGGFSMRHAQTFVVRDGLAVPVEPLKSLTCCCCGDGTIGRQWWNRDTGFGLCDGCIRYCGVKDTETYAESYGHRGVHFGLVP